MTLTDEEENKLLHPVNAYYRYCTIGSEKVQVRCCILSSVIVDSQFSTVANKEADILEIRILHSSNQNDHFRDAKFYVLTGFVFISFPAQ